jgi:sRNA-binding carbon storage regulator CsrA
LCFNFALEYAIRKVKENQMRLKINEPHQVLICAENIKLLEETIDTIKKMQKLYFTLGGRLVQK